MLPLSREIVKETPMATNLGIDGKLLEEAVRVGKQRTKKATVNEALREYIGRRKRWKALKLFGKVDFDPQHDYKAERRGNTLNETTFTEPPTA